MVRKGITIRSDRSPGRRIRKTWRRITRGPATTAQVHYIESSPADQLQPKHTTIIYRKPGDVLDIAYPALFDVETKKEIELDHALFPNAYT